MPNKHPHRSVVEPGCGDSVIVEPGKPGTFLCTDVADDNVAEPVVAKSGDGVNRFTSPLVDLDYHIYTDNYYTSVPLAMYLYSHRSYLSGTNA